MSRQTDESSLLWFERSIAANSQAADDLSQMQESLLKFNPAAQDSIVRRATAAQADLAAAQRAYRAEMINAAASAD